MSDPVDHSVRSLAEILREHGLESEAGTRPGTSGPPAGRRRRPGEGSTRPPVSGGDRRTGDRRSAGRRADDEATPAGPAAEPAPPRVGRRKTDVDLPEPVAPGQGVLFESGPTTAAIPGLRPSRTPGVPGGVGSRSGAPDLASTGPIPKVVLPAAEEEREPLTGRQSALAWARFAAELLVAVGVGIGVYYLFTVLWELLPYLAAVAAPVVVTGLVGGVATWRARQKQPPLETRVLLVLLFAGTLLAVVPAAGLLSGT